MIDSLTLPTISALIDSAPLTPFQRRLLEYYIFNDDGRIRKSRRNFVTIHNLSLTCKEIEEAKTEALEVLKKHFEQHGILGLYDVCSSD